MNACPPIPAKPLELAVRVGCKLIYDSPCEAPMLLNIKPRHDNYQLVAQESLDLSPVQTASEFQDDHANAVLRLNLPTGRTSLIYDAITYVPAASEDFMHLDHPVPANHLPAELLRYTLPSRYCDSDRLRNFAWQQFGKYRQGLERVQAICDWVHENIEYRTGSGSSEITAFDVIERGYGVCRDFAHCGVALCRTFNLPTRYVSGYVPDIACFDPGTPMDFHAYFEVFMGGRWQVFDARFNRPRTGRVRIATGYDAATCAFSTCYGASRLSWFEVWSYQVDPARTRVGDPVDLSQRLCGTPEIRRPPPHPRSHGRGLINQPDSSTAPPSPNSIARPSPGIPRNEEALSSDFLLSSGHTRVGVIGRDFIRLSTFAATRRFPASLRDATRVGGGGSGGVRSPRLARPPANFLQPSGLGVVARAFTSDPATNPTNLEALLQPPFDFDDRPTLSDAV